MPSVLSIFFYKLIFFISASSILIGDVVFGVTFADEKDGQYRDWKLYSLYYSFGLSVGAAGLTYVAALVAAFYDSYDK